MLAMSWVKVKTENSKNQSSYDISFIFNYYKQDPADSGIIHLALD